MTETKGSAARRLRSLLLTSALAAVALVPQLQREAASEPVPAHQWAAFYNGPQSSYDYANAVTADSAGNTYVTGRSDDDYVTAKYAPNGAQLWTARYAGPAGGLDNPTAVAVDADGNVYVTGASYGGQAFRGGTEYDYATVKYNPTGGEVWVARYGGTQLQNDAATALTLDAEGNALVTGYAWTGVNTWDFVTVKYAPSGMLLWTAAYDGAGSNDRATAIGTDLQGNVYVTGESSGNEATGFDFATVKYSPSGSQAWARRYNGPVNGNDAAAALAVADDGAVVVTGTSYGGSSAAGGTDFDIATVRYDTTGALSWSARLNGPAGRQDQGVALVLDQSGGAYVTGAVQTGQNGLDILTAKYGPTGSIVWSARYDGASHGDDVPSGIGRDDAGNTYITGYTTGNAGITGLLTAKFSTTGSLLWSTRYDGPVVAPASARGLVVGGDGSVVVSGQAWGASGTLDFATVRYPAPVPPPPVAPTGLVAVSSGGQVALTWQDNSDDETGFRVERRVGNTQFSTLIDLPAGSNGYTDATATASGQYSYRVRALGLGGVSDPSNTETISVSGGVPGRVSAPKKVSFGLVRMGKSKVKMVKITNTGKGTLSGTTQLASGAFTIVSGGGAFTLAPRRSQVIAIQFAPHSSGTSVGSLEIRSSDPSRPTLSVPVTGKAR